MKILTGTSDRIRRRKEIYNDLESREWWKLSNDSNALAAIFLYKRGEYPFSVAL